MARKGKNVLIVRFSPSRNFSFEPGQFISVIVPSETGNETVKRSYSLASSPKSSRTKGYELCVRVRDKGAGSSYLSSLRPGDVFRIRAPYGDFIYRAPLPGRILCLIATGTGIAPMRSIVTSEAFQEEPPERTIALIGCREEEEILYRQDFVEAGVETIYALSQPGALWKGLHGRVTDALRKFPASWPWNLTDFYLCGNVAMIDEITAMLRAAGVRDSAIRREAFFRPDIKEVAEPGRRISSTPVPTLLPWAK